MFGRRKTTHIQPGFIIVPTKEHFERARYALSQRIDNVVSLQDAINSYQPQFSSADICGLSLIISYFRHFFDVLLPFVVHSALRFPELLKEEFPEGLPLMQPLKPAQVVMSQAFACSILAGQFLLIFPKSQDNASRRLPLHSNFRELHKSRASSDLAKLTMFMNYFHRCAYNMQDTRLQLIFTRVVLDCPVDFDVSSQPLLNLQQCVGSIDDNLDPSVAQVDFANHRIGGGVLSSGAMQEEVRFAMCPELTVAVLFVEMLSDVEALIMQGAARHSLASGLGSNLQYAGPVSQNLPPPTVIAIDAVSYNLAPFPFEDQIQAPKILRDLTKAYVGFSGAANCTGVATGHWGCGSLRGDKGVKSLIQWAAASQAQKRLFYYAQEDMQFTRNLSECSSILLQNAATVGALVRALMQVANVVRTDQDRERFREGSREFFALVARFAMPQGPARSMPNLSETDQQAKRSRDPAQSVPSTPVGSKSQLMMKSNSGPKVVYEYETLATEVLDRRSGK
eukprot:c7317_g1_i2.p1 GENE.c7317_g1_i2~~c7317_g1_i2.p1  ORF type:complete len:509 (-),score=102.82 c7317_g1_i2:63-1589(-)